VTVIDPGPPKGVAAAEVGAMERLKPSLIQGSAPPKVLVKTSDAIGLKVSAWTEAGAQG
jgi:hypothetical protein